MSKKPISKVKQVDKSYDACPECGAEVTVKCVSTGIYVGCSTYGLYSCDCGYKYWEIVCEPVLMQWIV